MCMRMRCAEEGARPSARRARGPFGDMGGGPASFAIHPTCLCAHHAVLVGLQRLHAKLGVFSVLTWPRRRQSKATAMTVLTVMCVVWSAVDESMAALLWGPGPGTRRCGHWVVP